MKVFDYKCLNCQQITELWTFDDHKCRLCGSTNLEKVFTNYRFLERKKPYDYLKGRMNPDRISVQVPKDIKKNES